MFRLFNCYRFIVILISVRVCFPQNFNIHDEDQEPAFVSRVVNGWPATLGEVPYQLAMKALRSRLRRTYTTFCGGSIIGPNKVLSAAHCFENKMNHCQKCFGGGSVNKKSVQNSFAVAGNLANVAKYSEDSAGNGQWRRLKSMYFPAYYKFPNNDICVGFTRGSFVFNSNVASIPYATRHREYRGKCLASGYGRVSHWKGSDRLLLAKLNIIQTGQCNRIHRRSMRKFVCTSSVVSDVHKGDSGGPLVCTKTGDPSESGKGILVGVVSGSRRRAGSFFTRVSSFHSFVKRGRGDVIRGDVVLVLISLLYGGILLF